MQYQQGVTTGSAQKAHLNGAAPVVTAGVSVSGIGRRLVVPELGVSGGFAELASGVSIWNVVSSGGRIMVAVGDVYCCFRTGMDSSPASETSMEINSSLTCVEFKSGRRGEGGNGTVKLGSTGGSW